MHTILATVIAIALKYNSPSSASLVSWDAGGGSSWNVSLEGGHVGLPLVDISGELIATDGSTLVGYNSDGSPWGDPVVLYPVHGAVFDLSITQQNSIAILLYKCGFLATYLTGRTPGSIAFTYMYSSTDPESLFLLHYITCVYILTSSIIIGILSI